MLLLDLHSHSTYSDGTLTPQQLYDQATSLNLDYFAITDHDSLDSANFVTQTSKTRFIPGVELSVIGRKTRSKHHLLAYFPSTFPTSFCQKLSTIRRQRIERAENIILNLNFHFQLGLEFGEFAQFAGINLVNFTAEAAIGRPHVADFLVSKGVVANRKIAFQMYLGDNCPGYVPSPVYYLDEALRDVKENGGFAFLAHPVLFGVEFLAEDVAEGYENGMDGLEVYHSSNCKSYDLLLGLCDLHTCGSDYHCEETEWAFGCSEGNALMQEEDKLRLIRLFYGEEVQQNL